MKIVNHLILTIFIQGISTSTLHAVNNRPKQKPDIHFIGTWWGGFFASFNCVLNHISWCERNGKTPVVYWDERSVYHNPGGFYRKTNNVWEYYFESVSRVYAKPSSTINLEFFPKNESMEFCQDYIDQSTRNKAHSLIAKYIKIRQRTSTKINTFYNRNMLKKHTIGIHLRGTDKFKEVALVDAQKIVEVALQHAHNDTQFFVASDEQRLIQEIRSLLHDRKVISYNCYRSQNGNPLHLGGGPSAAQNGEDVLIEASLLSKCNMFIHTLSNVSTGVLYLNPHLPHVLVS